MKARAVPFTVKEAVVAEIDQLEQDGILINIYSIF